MKNEGHAVKLAKLDATQETVSKKKYKAGGFPTLRFFVNGEPYKYDGSRGEDVSISNSLVRFARSICTRHLSSTHLRQIWKTNDNKMTICSKLI